jgi:outer membrane protein
MTPSILIMFLLCGTVLAASDSLSLEGCLRLARENNPRGFAAMGAVQAAELAQGELQALALPGIKFRGTAEYAPMLGRFGYDPALTNGGQLGAQWVVEQSLYDGGQHGLKVKQSGFVITRSQFERKRAELDLRWEVTQAFIDVLRMQAGLDLKQAHLLRLRDYLGLVQRMHGGGQVGFTDVLKTRIQVSEAESDCNQTEADLAAARFSLAEWVGIDLDGSIRIKGSLDSVEPPTDLDTAGNADWEIARLDLRGAELDLEAARREWRPTLAVAADAGLLTSVENLRQPAQSQANMLGASIGLHVDVPVFGWGLRKIHLRQRQLSVDSLKWEWISRRRGLIVEHRKTLLQWDAAGNHRNALRADLSAAADNFSLTRSKYAGGQGLASEVLDAERLWADIQAALIQSQADLRVLGAKLKRLEAH